MVLQTRAIRNERLSCEERHRKALFWNVLARDTEEKFASSSFFSSLKLMEWYSAWACHGDPDQWDASRFDRREVCKELVEVAELLKTLAEGFICNSESEDVWLDLEEERLQRSYVTDYRKKKAREEEVVGDKEEQSKLARHAGMESSCNR